MKNVLIQFEKRFQDFEYFWIGVLCAVIFTVACLLFQEISEKSKILCEEHLNIWFNFKITWTNETNAK